MMSQILPKSQKLYDLTINWETKNTNHLLSQSTNFLVHYGFTHSPFGKALVMGTKQGICGIAFADQLGDDETLRDMMQRWPRTTFARNEELILKLSSPIFNFSGKTHLQVIGSPFQIKVWEALLQIQAGQVVTYSEVATAINKPSSVRAVATAIGRNPISFLIPCHRVIQKSGGLGGYHWGLPIKKHILNFENEKSRNPSG